MNNLDAYSVVSAKLLRFVGTVGLHSVMRYLDALARDSLDILIFNKTFLTVQPQNA
jgi:hypothetical protein